MTSAGFARLALVILLLAELPAHAQADAGLGGVLPSSAPQVSPDPQPTTNVIPVDRTVNDSITQANQELRSGYEIVSSAASGAQGALGQLANQPLTLYRDGMGGETPADPADARDGGFGDWQMLGTKSWGVERDAALHGAAGFTPATLPGGLYPARAGALLLSPEIDLRTNPAGSHSATTANAQASSASQTCASSTPTPPSLSTPASPTPRSVGACSAVGPAPVPDLGFSQVYHMLYWACGSARQTIQSAEDVTPAGRPVSSGLEPICSAYQHLLDPSPQAVYTSFQYQRRFNLGSGVDGVQVMIFTSPPTAVDEAKDCQAGPPVVETDDLPVCRIALPQLGYQGAPAIFHGGSANTGFSDWAQDAIDLTDYEGRSVWIGFYFGSSAFINAAYFHNPARFVGTAGFVGFDLDDAQVQAPAAPVNLRVRPLTQPSFKPPGFLRPTLNPADPIPVAANVTNFGSTSSTVTIVTRILGSPTRTTVATRSSESLTLPPGAYVKVHQVFQPLPVGSYVAQVCVERDDSGRPGGDPQFCQGGTEPGACSSDRLAADPCAQLAEEPFDLRPVDLILPGSVERGADQVQLGDAVSFGIPLRNAGNTPQSVKVQAHLVDVATRTFAGDDLIRPEDRGPRTVFLPAGATSVVQWEVQASRRGQFRPFVQIGNAPPFDPKFDLRPQVMKPWDAAPVLAGSPIIVDGLLDDWAQPPMSSIGYGDARLQLANDDHFVYVALSDTTARELTIFLDDRGDQKVDGTHDLGFIVNLTKDGTRTNLTTLRFDSASMQWHPAAGNGQFEAKETTFVGPDGTLVPGRYTFELKIPINGTQAAGPQAKPGDALGVLIAFCQALSRSARCDELPARAPLYDGEAFLAPDGSLGDELSQWSTIRLHGTPFTAASSAFMLSALGQGFGVGTVAPPYLYADFDSCPDFQGWQHLEGRAPSADLSDKWTCGDYADDGRSLLYKGLVPTSLGAGPTSGFLPYAGVPHYGRPTWYGDPKPFPNGAIGYRAADGYAQDTDDIWTAPFELPADAADPVLILSHQYSTDVSLEGEQADAPFFHSEGRIRVNHRLNVGLEQWTGDGWKSLGVLEPAGGYSSERSVGLANATSPTHPYYADAECVPAKGPPSGDPPRYRLQNVLQLCGFTHQDSSWWWPQGDQPLAKSNDTGLPTGASFNGGSPWRTDLIPLTASNAGGAPLQVAGSTVRLRFSYYASDQVRNHNRTLDWGWRIGGLAVIEGERFARDIAVTAAGLDLPYDASKIGVGPGTTVPVRVTVLNAGQQDVQGIQLTLVGQDVSNDRAEPVELCRADGVDVPGALLAGQARNITIPCVLPDAPGALLSIHVSAALTRDLEDYRGNNEQRVRGTFLLAAHPAARLRVDVSPREATAASQRALEIHLENAGNVPLTGMGVGMRLLRVTDGELQETGISHQWALKQSLLVSAAGLTLSAGVETDPPIVQARDFNLRPPGPGTYVVTASLVLPGASAASDNESVHLLASETLYTQDFDGSDLSGSDVVQGTMSVGAPWSLAGHGSQDGSGFAGAGDAATGEIPAKTDGYLTLPTLDLTSAKRAVLSFTHRYDLEESFDGGRVEMSTDGGRTWVPLVPRSQPLNGLPLGYPSLPLLGTSGLQNESVESFATAYTGQSSALPGSQDGWVAAEFDLARQPQFWATTVVDALGLNLPAAYPDPEPVGPEKSPEFRSPSWTLPEANAEGNLRYWWIDNQTYAAPQPRVGTQMWWSGSAGSPNAEGDILDVDTSLGVSFATAGVERSPQDRILVSFWDWRAGGANALDAERDGTGGQFIVHLLPTGQQPVDYRIAERLGSGWTRREVDVTPLVGSNLGLDFQYRSGPNFKFPQSGSFWTFTRPEVENDLGWFIGGVSLIRRTDAGDQILAQRDPSGQADWSVGRATGTVEWRPVGAGAAAQPGGWHVESGTPVPGKGAAAAWRFSSSDPEGYPANADSRLVTPLVDLRQYVGDSAALAFDHRFDFHGDNRIGGLAVDGGEVEYQVLDDSSGTFGAWHTLGAIPEPRPLSVSTPSYDSSIGRELYVANDAASRDRFLQFGYTSIMPEPLQKGASGNEIRLGSGDIVQTGDPDFGATLLTFSPPARIDWVSSSPAHAYLDVDGDGFLTAGDFDLLSGARATSSGGAYAGVRLLPQAIQWVDLDGDGRWGSHDAAILSASQLHKGPAGSVVQAGDLRLTAPVGFIVAGEPLIGAALRSPGTFLAFCRTGTSEGSQPTDALYLSPNSADCSGHLEPQLQIVSGSSFETFDGWVQHQPLVPHDVVRNWDQQYWARQRLPLSYVFSGDSRAFYPDTAGWNAASFDVSRFIGKQVRFGFHAWTNPSRQPCGDKPVTAFFGVSAPYSGPACDGDPLDGWSVANVAVVGQQFRGKPIQIRFHVATDDSMTKGSWAIDDVVIAGERYRDAVVMQPESPERSVASGSAVSLEGAIRNLGSTPHSALAMAIKARRADTGAVVPVTIVEPSALPSLPLDQVPPGFQLARGPFPLAPGGTDGGEIPIRLDLTMPAADGTRIIVDVQILDLNRDVACSSGAASCPRSFLPIANERGAGSGLGTWAVRGVDRRDVDLVPPEAGNTFLLVPNQTIVQIGTPVSFLAKVLNNGTVTAGTVSGAWTIVQLGRKGGSGQLGTEEKIKKTFTLPTGSLANLAPGQARPFSAEFVPSSEGLYRARLTVTAQGFPTRMAEVEFHAGPLAPYYAVDFSKTDATKAGWQDASGVGSPDPIKFRQVSGGFAWGVSGADFFSGLEYCAYGGCNPAATTGSPEPPIVGLEGIGQSPVVDLGQVVGKDATLTLREGNVMAAGDGAALEVLPVRWPLRSTPEPVFGCSTPDGDTVPAWFRLVPNPASALKARVQGYAPVFFSFPGIGGGPGGTGMIQARQNPLGDGAAIGGPGVDSELLSFPLSGAKPFVAACPDGTSLQGSAPSSFVNYTLQLRVRTGTTPGLVDSNCNSRRCPDSPRVGAMGIHIGSVRVTSIDARLEPAVRELPVRDGLAKEFNAEIRNLGTVGETFAMGVDMDAGTAANASWFGFPRPNVFVPAGGFAIVPFSVTVPAEPLMPRGTYIAYLTASSKVDPTLVARSELHLELAQNPLPDLSVQLATEAEGTVPEIGKELRLFVTVANRGQASSVPVPLQVDVVQVATGQRTNIATADVGPLCPEASCGPQLSSITSAYGWIPSTAGLYRIEARVDPLGRLIEERVSDNVAVESVQVLTLQRSDVAVTDLQLGGVGADGFALAGDLVTIAANVTNVGATAATNVEVRILAGTSEVLETVLPSLAPDETRVVTAAVLASGKEVTIRALAVPAGSELFADNNELRRILRVRAVSFALEPDESVPSIEPGGTATTLLAVHNLGNAPERVALFLDSTMTGWSLAVSPNPVNVAANSTSFVLLSLKSPSDVVAGLREVLIRASPSSQPTLRALGRVPIQVGEIDHEALGQVEPALLAPGMGEIPVKVDAASNVQRRLSLVLEQPGWGLAPVEGVFEPGTNATMVIPVRIPSLAAPGTTAVKIGIYDEDGVRRGQALGTVEVAARPNASAALAGLESADAGLLNRTFTVNVRIANDGNVPIVPSIEASRFSVGTELVPMQAPSPLAAGDSRVVPVVVRVDTAGTESASGTLVVFMRAVDGADADPSAYNLTEVARLALPPLSALPDLQITDVAMRPGGAVRAGEPVRITVTIRNTGLRRAGPSVLQAYVNGDAVNEYDVPAIEANSSRDLTLTWSFAKAGQQLVHLDADAANGVNEVYEDNNGWNRVVNVLDQDHLPNPAAPGAGLATIVLAVLVAIALAQRRGPSGGRRGAER